MLKYVRKGGIAGKEDTILVDDDGSTRMTSMMSGRLVINKTFRLPNDELMDLRQFLSLPEFQNPESQIFDSHTNIRDGITHSLDIDTQQVNKHLSWQDQARIPMSLKQVQAKLAMIISRAYNT